jgi:hypothetical protein
MPLVQWVQNPVFALESIRDREDALLYPADKCDAVVLVGVGLIPESVGGHFGTAMRELLYGQCPCWGSL